jgi:hypothetical protein
MEKIQGFCYKKTMHSHKKWDEIYSWTNLEDTRIPKAKGYDELEGTGK